MDIRMVKLYKLHLPKSQSFSYLVGDVNSELNGHKYYFTMGNYDLIDVTKINLDKNSEHVLSQIHSFSNMESEATENRIISENDFSCQRLYVFTECKDSEREAEISKFWDENETKGTPKDDHLFFVSMLHVNDYVDGQIDLSSVLKCIEDSYSGMSYLYYFTLDYSDIIIFSKTKTVGEYLNATNKLNYNNNTRKIVRDSFSIYGICRRYMLNEFTRINKILSIPDTALIQKAIKNFLQEDDHDPTFFVKVNISVQNYKTVTSFREQLNMLLGNSQEDGRIEINQFGRFDFSIINQNATLHWFILVEYLIDKYTTAEGNIRDTDVFLTFEAFVGMSAGNYDDTGAPDYIDLKTEPLQVLCQSFQKELELRYKNAENYYLPVNEVENSIRSITRNRFADDFVICMYESFYRFVEYMRNKVANEDLTSTRKYLLNEDFDSTFNNYFRGLIALANSAMHDDRSFVQATAFNAILYDIPPKLMAFYTATVYKMINIMRDDDDNNYAFLFVPNFSNDIIVKSIANKNISDNDKLFLVSINENFFYNPPGVIMTMGHEVAHFAGENKRMRYERFHRYIKCIVYTILSHTLPRVPISDSLNIAINNIYELLSKQIEYKHDELQAKHFNNLISAVCRLMYANENIDSIIKSYIKDNIQDDWISEMRIIYPIDDKVQYVFEQYKLNLDDIINERYVDSKSFRKTLELIKIIFSEVYADLQMIIILNLSFEEYIDKFIKNEKLVQNKLVSDLHIKRFSIVTKAMMSLGVWNGITRVVEEDAEGTKLTEFWNKLNDNIEQISALVDNNIIHIYQVNEIRELYASFYTLLNNKECQLYQNASNNHDIDTSDIFNMQIYLYLISVLKTTMEEYVSKDRTHLISELHRSYKTIKEFNDINEIYSVIRKDIEAYRQNINYRLHD